MKRIIIVEVDMILAMLLEKEIQRMGHEVTAKVDSAEAAISTVKQNDLDIILMDISLIGDMDGIEAMNHIRMFSDIPVIYLTGNADRSIKERAMETEPHGYLTKPLQTEKLEQVISKLFNGSRNGN